MGQIARPRLGHRVYQVCTRAHAGGWILAEPEHRRQLLTRLARFALRHEVPVYTWAIMANRFRLAAAALTAQARSRWRPRARRGYRRRCHRERVPVAVPNPERSPGAMAERSSPRHHPRIA
jgi:hypothetical protein